MCLTLIGILHPCKGERKGDKNLIFIKKVKWFLHINGWAQIAKRTRFELYLRTRIHCDPSNKMFLVLWIICGELEIRVLLVWIKFHHYLCDKWCMSLSWFSLDLKYAFLLVKCDLVNPCATWCSHYWLLKLIFRFV
jgi:hypothetical protein